MAVITRRDVLSGLATLTAAGVWSRLAAAQGATAARTRIDTHHHVFPTPYVAGLAAAKITDGIATAWSVARTLDDMEKAGVATSILSVTQPATTFAEPAVARRIARQCNE